MKGSKGFSCTSVKSERNNWAIERRERVRTTQAGLRHMPTLTSRSCLPRLNLHICSLSAQRQKKKKIIP